MDIDKLKKLEKSINARLNALLDDDCYDSDGYKSFHKNSIIKEYYVEIFKTTLDLIEDFKCVKASDILLRNYNIKLSEEYQKQFHIGIVKRIEDLENTVNQLREIK
jgi:hypothetical protein